MFSSAAMYSMRHVQSKGGPSSRLLDSAAAAAAAASTAVPSAASPSSAAAASLSTASAFGAYSLAFVRQLHPLMADQAVRMDAWASSASPFDAELAQRQHAEYVEVLQGLLPTVVSVAADPLHPDSVFIEDAAVVIGDTAFITTPGHVSRRGETGPVRDMLTLRGFNTVSAPEDALIDGGDVMFTGRELFVGMSSRTTDKGVKALQAAFPAVPVHTVKFSSSETLHLKSMMSMGAPDTVIAADTPVATLALSSMLKQALHPLQICKVPDTEAANCLFINGTLVHRSAEEFPVSASLLKTLGYPTVEVNASELAKCDGALTCCSLLCADPSV